MSPEMIRFRKLMAEYAQELRGPTRDQMETWALVEIAYQLDRIADSLANMEPESACPYCRGDGVERIVGRDNDVIEQPCSRGCPTPFQRDQANG